MILLASHRKTVVSETVCPVEIWLLKSQMQAVCLGLNVASEACDNLFDVLGS